MEGIYFYWCFWCIWIFTTFIMEKTHPQRFVYSFCILATIVLTAYTVNMNGMQIPLVSIFLICCVYVEISRWTLGAKLYFVITSMIIMLAFVSFQLFEMYDPVWVLFNRHWMFALILTYVCILLYQDSHKRLVTLIFGAVHGDIFFNMIMFKHSFELSIGSFRFLDVLGLSIMLLTIWIVLEKLSYYFERYSLQLRKGKNIHHE